MEDTTLPSHIHANSTKTYKLLKVVRQVLTPTMYMVAAFPRATT